MLQKNKKAFEAPWWVFLIGLLVAIFVAVFLLIFTGNIKLGAENIITKLGEKLGELF